MAAKLLLVHSSQTVNREKKQKIMSIIEQKQDTALSAMSIEELSAMVASL